MADKPFPTTEGDIELFIENLADKVPQFATDLDLSVGDGSRMLRQRLTTCGIWRTR